MRREEIAREKEEIMLRVTDLERIGR
jgi:folylpolyglutamate synthase/dihydropteroate synthase